MVQNYNDFPPDYWLNSQMTAYQDSFCECDPDEDEYCEKCQPHRYEHDIIFGG